MILHREEIGDPGLHGNYSEYAATPEDACLLGYPERKQRTLLYLGVGGHEASFWAPDHTFDRRNEEERA